MPWVATATAFAILEIIEALFFNGSISKYMIAYETTHIWVTTLLNLINLEMIRYFVKYAAIFFGQNPKVGQVKYDKYTVGASLIMGVIALLTGIFL